jgi:hypothetical protein
MLDDLMIGSIPIPHANRQMVLDMLRFNNVIVMTGTRLVEVTNGGAFDERGFKENNSER